MRSLRPALTLLLCFTFAAPLPRPVRALAPRPATVAERRLPSPGVAELRFDLDGSLAPAGGGPAAFRAGAFLSKHAALLGGAEPRLVETVERPGLSHCIFELAAGTLPLVDRSARVAVASDGSVVGVMVDAVELPSGGALVRALSRPQAVRKAFDALDARLSLLRAPVEAREVAVVVRGGLTPCWEVQVASGEPLGDFRVVVDGASGAVLAVEELSLWATGTGRVYESNPVHGEPVEVSLLHLDGLSALRGSWAVAVNDDAKPASEADGRYLYEVDDTHFDEVQAYHHVTAMHDYCREILGFTGLDRPMKVTVHYGKGLDNAFYSPLTKAIALGDGTKLNDLAKEAGIIHHEYTHAVTDSIVKLAYSAESGAMAEGYSDYFACSLTNDPAIGEWAVRKMGKPWLRHLEQVLHYPEDLEGEVHADGRIWGCALWDLRAALGAPVADRLVHESRYFLTKKARFADGLAGCLKADRQLFGGEHESVVREVFAARGIRETGRDVVIEGRFRGLFGGEADGR